MESNTANKEKTYVYFVSYEYVGGCGSTFIRLNKELNSVKLVKQVNEYINTVTPNKQQAVITFWKELAYSEPEDFSDSVTLE